MTADRSRDAEAALHAAGFSQIRVAGHGDVARLAVPPADFERFAGHGVREAVVAAVRAAGYRFVALDLDTE